MPHIDNTRKKWENRHKTFNDPIKQLYSLFNGAGDALATYNEMTEEVKGFIKKADADGTTLRALGAGWSWHQIMTGGPKGIMLDTKPLNTIFPISQARLDSTYTKEAKKLRFVQCGAGIWELNKALKAENLSLKTTGASNGQTIAGLIGTGAHGSAIDVGAAQDFVVGLHIIVSSNRHVYLERASYPVVNQSFANLFNTEIIKDDDIFNAALVSFGCFGFVHGVMVEVEDIFLLDATMRKQPFTDDVVKVMKSLDFTTINLPGLANGNERPYHFEVKLNPYDTENKVFITGIYKRPYRKDYIPPVANPQGIGPGDDAPAFIGKLFENVPSLIPAAVNALTKSSLTLYENAIGTIGEIFNNTTLRGKLLSAAIGIPNDKVMDVIDVLKEINQDIDIGNFPGLFAFRFVKGTKATIGFTKFDHTCVVEMDGAYNDRSIAYCKAVWDKLQERGIPFTCHWGKQTDLSPKRIEYMYGKPAIKSWKDARNSLLDAASKKVFTNPIMEKWGMNS